MNYLRELAKPIRLEDADPGFDDMGDGQKKVFELQLKLLEEYMDKYLILYFYRIKSWAKVSTRPAGQRLLGGGLDTYVCMNAANSKKARSGSNDGTGTTIQDYKCKAKFTINYPPGYFHLKDKAGNPVVRNVEDFGEQRVRITWVYFHSHKFNDPNECAKDPLSPRGRDLLFLAVQGHVTMADVVQMQTTHSNDFLEIHKVKSDTVRYYKRKKLTLQAIKDSDIRTSLLKHAESIESSGGLAEFREEFHSHGSEVPRSGAESEGYVWSFWFMTAWQRKFIERTKDLSHVFYLDSTHETCHGLHKTEDTYLYTSVLKYQETNEGAPIAFMLTNRAKRLVIADFLSNLKTRADFSPSQAIIGCNMAETEAVQTVLDIPFMWCQFLAKQAFKKEANDKITESPLKPAIVKAATVLFHKLMHSDSCGEAERNTEKCREVFKEYPGFLEYMERQWFDNPHNYIRAYNAIFVQEGRTNDLIDAYHRKLKWDSLKKCRKQRPDIFVLQLLTLLVPEYMANVQRRLKSFRSKTYDEAEKEEESKCDGFDSSRIMSMVYSLGAGELEVESFTNVDLTYRVSLQYAGLSVSKCSCAANQNSGSWCKHIFLAQKWWKIMAPTDPREEKANLDVFRVEQSMRASSEEQDSMEKVEKGSVRLEGLLQPQSQPQSTQSIPCESEENSLDPIERLEESFLENEDEMYGADMPDPCGSDEKSDGLTDTDIEEIGEGDASSRAFTDACRKRKMEEMDRQLDLLSKKTRMVLEKTLKKCKAHGTKRDQIRALEAMLAEGERQLQSLCSMNATQMSSE